MNAGDMSGHDLFFSALGPSPVPMLVTDPNQLHNPILFANAAFATLTGYRMEEILGRNCRFLQGAETDPTSVATVRTALEACRGVSVELLNYRKDGSSFWNALFISPVFTPEGRLLYFFASQADVSARRQIEARLEHYEGFDRASMPDVATPPNPSAGLIIASVRRWRELEGLAADAENNLARRALDPRGALQTSAWAAERQLAMRLREAATRAQAEAFRLLGALAAP